MKQNEARWPIRTVAAPLAVALWAVVTNVVPDESATDRWSHLGFLFGAVLFASVFTFVALSGRVPTWLFWFVSRGQQP